ncbi:MAG: peptidyl-prolyl cis-trans isomerase [Gaiellaceae bacterium]
MPSFPRTTALLLALVLALAATACGSDEGAGEVPPGAIAVVGEREIPKAEFDRLIAQAEKNFESQQQELPAAGTPEYESLKSAIVRSLVEQATWEQKAEEMNIEVTGEEVDERLAELKQQYFQGDEEQYAEEIEKQGLTDERVRQELETRLLSEKIYEAVTKQVKVTDAEIQAYYEENEEQFAQPESREVRHILVGKKARADRVHRELHTGTDFARLAKRESDDEGTAADGGKLTAVKGRTAAPFDEFVFAAETGQLSKPIKTEFGWHVIEVLSAVKPDSVTPLAEVEDQVRETLLREKQNQAMQKWVADLKTEFEAEIAYAPGYKPAPEPTQTEQAGTTTE